MEIEVVDTSPSEVKADLLAFPVPEPVELAASAREIDELLDGGLTRLQDDGELKGRSGTVAVLHTIARLAALRVAGVGVGKRDEVDADRLRTAAAKAATRTSELGGQTLAWIIEEGGVPLSPAEQTKAVIEGASIGAYDPGRWKTETNDRRRPAERLVLCGAAARSAVEVANRAAVIARWTRSCRDLVNAPGNELTPAALADFAKETADRFPLLQFEALGPEEIRAAGMGALAGVGQASHNPPRLITLAYEPPEPARPDVRLGLVGKAITFDSGGLSLKPSARMDAMKADMGGGAAVLAGTAAIAELELPLRVLAVIPACENMPGGHAIRPGDILTAASGKTIEVTNTDAEGRLVLADALWHARESGATHLLDLATLTGAIVVAIGDFYAGLFGNDDEWIQEILAAAKASGDHAWHLPLHETYARYIRSWYADMKNTSDLRQAAPVYAARFLQEFAGEGPWAHLDIAGTAFLDRGRGDYYSGRGATGYGVRLLAELAGRLSG